MTSLAERYQAYLDCLNAQNWEALGEYVADDVRHNGRDLGLSGYREMLIGNYEDIPDLSFKAGLLVCEAAWVAARLDFDCTPKGEFLGVPVNGQRVAFRENVFYEFRDGRIVTVWSVVDKAGIEEQLNAG